MTMLETLFQSSQLDVVVPISSLPFPSPDDGDSWISSLNDNTIERDKAFFDEQLRFLLLLRITPADDDVVDSPSKDLVSFLQHLQVSLEATYISSVASISENPTVARLSAPPRKNSMGKVNQRNTLAVHPSIFPPATPHPTPITDDHDRQYVRSEGTLLYAGIWGQDSREAFALFYSKAEKRWIAVYQLNLSVLFLRVNISDPLLCLTVSTTLREKPLTITANHPFLTHLEAIGVDVSGHDPNAPLTAAVKDNDVDELGDLEEVNLLEGLASNPTFSSKDLILPSSRLGPKTRHDIFSLPPPRPISPDSPNNQPPPNQMNSTLRKSFRKTLRTVSGFRVRMRTVFVPYMLLSDSDAEDGEEECERREAGDEERTVVLCVEIENTGESGPNVDFVVESIDINVGGGGATTTLIGWKDGGGLKKSIFPLRIGRMDQYNLLYALSFLHPPEDEDLITPLGKEARRELQRAIAIHINGKPTITNSGVQEIHPTDSFSSRWNCVLDLSPQQSRKRPVSEQSLGGPKAPEALPEPPSPFPMTTTTATAAPSQVLSAPTTAVPAVVAGNKRQTTMLSQIVTNQALRLSGAPKQSENSNRASLPAMHLSTASGGSSIVPPPSTAPIPIAASAMTNPNKYLPPSVLNQQNFPRSPTTYTYGESKAADIAAATLSSPPLPMIDSPPASATSPGIPPVTPAYPAYPTAAAYHQHPHAQGGPMTFQRFSASGGAASRLGPSVEIRRERGQIGFGAGGGGGDVPPTPGPLVIPGGMSGGGGSTPGLGTPGLSDQQAYFLQQQQQHQQQQSLLYFPHPEQKTVTGSSEPIVVSVGLVHSPSTTARSGPGQGQRILPLDRFSLDIFVFNKSGWTRRMEIGYPDRRALAAAAGVGGAGGAGNGPGGVRRRENGAAAGAGVIPLENRLRVGPLRPSTSQSLRMEFLALSPGVHTIEMLTLTDVETGYVITLRSVMDVVVHEPDVES